MPASFHLVMRSGPTIGKVYPLEKGEILIGRDLNNDVTINDPEISRRHARLYAQGNTYVLEDLGSTNGTFVGGQRLTGAYPLRLGEVITFGERITFVFEAAQVDEDATVVSQAPRVIPAAPPAELYHAPAQPFVASQPATHAQPAPSYPVQPTPAPVQPPIYQAPIQTPPPASYAGQVPEAEEPEPAPEKPKSRTTLILLLVLAAVLVVACICVVVMLWNAPLEFWCQFPIWPAGACP